MSVSWVSQKWVKSYEHRREKDRKSERWSVRTPGPGPVEKSRFFVCFGSKTNFLQESFDWVEKRLHTENPIPSYSGKGLKVWEVLLISYWAKTEEEVFKMTSKCIN